MNSKYAAQAAEVLSAYKRYLEAFMSNDMNGINALVSYPLAYVGDGVVKMFNEYPIRPSELMAQTGWQDTLDMQYEVVAVSDTKAHLILRSGTSVRGDGLPIEAISGFYAWTKTTAGWKKFAFSDVRMSLLDRYRSRVHRRLPDAADRPPAPLADPRHTSNVRASTEEAT